MGAVTAFDKFRRLLAGATPGPWRIEEDSDYDDLTGRSYSWPWRIPGVVSLTEEDNDRIETDAVLIVALRNTAEEWAALRDELEALDLSDSYIVDNAAPGELVRCTRPIETWRRLRDALAALDRALEAELK